MPRDVHLLRKPWLSLGSTAERSGKGILRYPPRSVRETCAWERRRDSCILTNHPLSSHVNHILLNNFNILTTYPATATIFPAPPVVAHRRDRSLWDILVHTSDRSQTEEPGTFACRHPRCRTCLYTTSNVHVDPRVQPPPWTLYLQIRECCVLHLVPSMPPAIHRGDRSYTARTIRRTSSERPKEHWWFPGRRALPVTVYHTSL